MNTGTIKNLGLKIFYKFQRNFSHAGWVLSNPSQKILQDNGFLGNLEDSDIAEHLHLLYLLAITKNPRSILELGTRGGESTRALKAAAISLGIQGFSIDLDSAPPGLDDENWQHFVGNDLELGVEFAERHLLPDGSSFENIDFLFIDTSHEYHHTLEELRVYWPLVSRSGVVVFHDTNLSAKRKRMLSGRIYSGWNNNRGVIAAIEDFFAIKVPEDKMYLSKKPTELVAIYHVPWSNGLTVLVKS